ncbi:rhamnogalacturonan acetylesterase [uncultured Bacteroides sp.]|uniref:rhamnogalacturonan acetylesterase n=1 Tax=uncultured Bacteroides sp. TaxID=162156 RepID=UPI0023CC5845|nr:rhamnogalacturonan acetylesterase [uncultured Bacteroides sp.]MDE6173572.1 rhamnogalacturonan acetylesterase [Bacteroides sp.]
MKQFAKLMILGLSLAVSAGAQNYKFDFTSGKKAKDGYVKVTPDDRYDEAKGYGYDLTASPDGKSKVPFFFSITVPDGNYRITAVVGSKRSAGETTVRGESRRLFFENVKTRKGELLPCTFTINKRDKHISEKEDVRIKLRERSKLNWDDKLTLEFNGDAPQVSELIIDRVEDVPTVFLCGNSTVVDQDNEPWASWGQMVTRFFTDSICFANYAESGESANTFISAGRLKKALTQMKPGDYIFMEFGHNDQKQKGPGKGAFYSFMTSLKTFVDEARARGAQPILVTPTQRRSFDENGKIKDTHLDFPDAVRWLAEKENIPLVDLHAMTRILYEAMGVEESKQAFVHYPANTYPQQTKPLADNTHFNPYGAYQIAKCVIEGMKKAGLPIVKFLRADYEGYNPAQPDALESFKWNDSPFTELEKPDGN